jgi:hypothetical protein
MTSPDMDDLDMEYEDAYDDSEDYDAEGYDDESTASRRRAAQRRRRRLMAARRRAAARGRGGPPAKASPRAVVSAVKELDLQGQVQQDELRAAITAQNKKLDRAGMAAVGTALVPELFRAFGTPDNTALRIGIQALPLALLPTGAKRDGVLGILQHPAVYGGGALLAVGLIADARKRGTAVKTIKIIGPTQLTVRATDQFLADVLDTNDKPSTAAVTWKTENVTAATSIDSTSGKLTAGDTPGVAIISATADTVTSRVRLEVVPDGSVG